MEANSDALPADPTDPLLFEFQKTLEKEHLLDQPEETATSGVSEPPISRATHSQSAVRDVHDNLFTPPVAHGSSFLQLIQNSVEHAMHSLKETLEHFPDYIHPHDTDEQLIPPLPRPFSKETERAIMASTDGEITALERMETKAAAGMEKGENGEEVPDENISVVLT